MVSILTVVGSDLNVLQLNLLRAEGQPDRPLSLECQARSSCLEIGFPQLFDQLNLRRLIQASEVYGTIYC